MGLTERGDQRVRYLWREGREMVVRAEACARAGGAGTVPSGQSLSPVSLLEEQGLFLGAPTERKQMGWALLPHACVAGVRQPRATRSLDLYELSMFVCILAGGGGGGRSCPESRSFLSGLSHGERRG